jgi:uncharacterized protein (TIGR00725 family)
MRKTVIGVMGPGEGADRAAVAHARELGRRIAEQGWVLLSGGRDCGVMKAVCEGAKEVPGSLTVGVLPSAGQDAALAVDVVIATDLGSGRNNINVLSSDVVIAVGRGGPGTASEVALALKAGKPVILLDPDPLALAFFEALSPDLVGSVKSPAEAVTAARSRVESRGFRS